jgi:DNA-binding response OmpR family regulator
MNITANIAGVADDRRESLAHSRAPGDPEASMTGSLRRAVLIVEDNPDMQSLLAYYFAAKGYTVWQAENGQEGIDLARSTPVDFVLVDFDLPLLNGLTVVRHLREELKLESLPIVMMTCHGYRVLHSAVNVGCNDFLPKPLDFDRLDQMLEYFAPAIH